MLPCDIKLGLRQSVDENLVIGSLHVGFISLKFGKFSKIEKYPPFDINLKYPQSSS
jgi:hypothetical protein